MAVSTSRPASDNLSPHPSPPDALSPESAATVQRQVRDHLLLNFTDLAAFRDRDIPIISHGDGCYVVDTAGRRFIDGLSGLFCSNLGHGFGAEIGRAAQAQLAELVFTPSWYLTHPGTARLAARLAELAAPLALNRVFLTSGGGEAVEAAWKLARQWHAAHGQPQRRKAISRRLAYHGTSLGALSFTGLPDIRHPFEPLPVPVGFISETDAYRHPAAQGSVQGVSVPGSTAQGPAARESSERFFTAALLAEAEAVIEWEGPDQIAMLIAEPVQNSGGAFVPPAGYWPGLRALCDRYGILLVADETITGFGRVGEWFASLRYDIRPDLITFAKGVSAGHAPLGGVLMGDKVAEPFTSGRVAYQHGLTYSGHPLATAVAETALAVYTREQVLENVRALEPFLRQRLNELRRIPLVGDVRGAGFFWALELVRDRETKERFTPAEADRLLRVTLSGRLDQLGLLCRLDDRGEPVLQLSPPLVADQALLARMCDIVATALESAQSTL